MLTRRTLIKSASAMALGAPFLSFAQARYKPEYRLSLVVGPGTAWYRVADRFATLVRERTAGRIQMKLYPGSSLVQGQQDRELVALRQGVIDVLVGTSVNWSGTVKDLGVFSLPYLMPDSKAVDAVLASDALNKDFYDILRRVGMEPLASGEYGNVQLINAKHRLSRPEEVKGLKMRVVGTPMQQELMAAMGANPTSMSWADAQAALASGAVDGLTLTTEQFLAYKLHTLGQKHVTRWNLYNELIHISIAAPVFKAWSAEDQGIVRQAARDAARELTDNVRNGQAADVAALKSLGVEVYDPGKAELAQWQAVSAPVFTRWKGVTNPKLVDKIIAAVKQSAAA